MNDSLRVAMLTQQYYPVIGGVERQLAEQARTFRSMGVQVQVITRRTQHSESIAQVEGIPVYRVPTTPNRALSSLSYTANALKWIRQLKPDIVHAHGLLSTARTGLLAQRFFSHPLIVTIHNLDLDVQRLEQTPIGARQLSALWQNANAFVLLNTPMDDALARWGVPPERRSIIPNGVDPTRFAPVTYEEKQRLRAELGAPEGPIILFVGRLVAEKRVDVLLRAWSVVSNTYPHAQLWIVGDGALLPSLRELAGVNVRFIGQVQDVISYLRIADIFVLASATEGLSVALLEALSTELPVIATEIDGMADVIENGCNAVLVPPGDVSALARVLALLLDDAELRTHLGRAGRATVLQKFDIAATTQRLHELYCSVLDATPRRPRKRGAQ